MKSIISTIRLMHPSGAYFLGFAFLGLIAISVIGLPIQNGEEVVPTSGIITPVISDMKIQEVKLTGMTLSWAPDEEEVITYKIYKDNLLLATVPGSVHVHKITGLKPNTWHQFSIEACGGSGNCGKSPLVGGNTITVHEATESIINEVNYLVSTSVLTPEQGDAIINELASIYKLEDNNPNEVVKHFQAAIKNANSLINTGVLTPKAGQPLVDAINDVINNIS